MTHRKLLIAGVSAMAIALLAIASLMSHQVFSDARDCVVARAEQKGSERREDAGPPAPAALQPVTEGRQVEERADGDGKTEGNGRPCGSSRLGDEALIGLAGLQIAHYAFVAALLFAVVALLGSFIPLADGSRDGPNGSGPNGN